MSGQVSRALAVAIALMLSPLPRSGAEAAPRRFTFGVILERQGEADLALGLYGGLLAALRTRVAASGVEVMPLVVARDVTDLARRVERGEVDAFAEGVFTSLIVRELSGASRPGLVALRRGEREYRSVIIAAKDGPVRSLADLEGRTVVFQAPRSTSAYALPKAELLRLGFDLRAAEDPKARDRTIRFVFAGAEINQAIWVLHGKGDAAAFNEGDWSRLPEGVRNRLRIIHETPPILRWVVSFRSGLDAATRKAVEAAFVALGDRPGDRLALEQARIGSFERLTESDQAAMERWAPLLARLRGEK